MDVCNECRPAITPAQRRMEQMLETKAAEIYAAHGSDVDQTEYRGQIESAFGAYLDTCREFSITPTLRYKPWED